MQAARQTTMSIVRRAATVIAILVTAMATMATSDATAATSGDISAVAYGQPGWAYFNADILVLSIHDSHADGYGVVVPYFRSDVGNTKPYYAWNRYGNDTTSYYYFHMPYGTRFKFQVCREKAGMLIGGTCGASAYAYAGPQL